MTDGAASSVASVAPRASSKVASSPSRPDARRDAPVGAATERDDPEPVAALGREVTDGDRDALGDVGLAAKRRAERHRWRDVEDEPGRQRPLRDVDPDVRDGRAGGDVPVDAADVVARLIRTDLGELEPAAEIVRPELAGEHAVDPTPDRQVERAEQRDRRRARVRVAPSGGAWVGTPRSCRLLRRDELRARATAGRIAVEDHVRGHLLGERREARHDPVAEHVAGELDDVARQDVAAATDDGQGAGGVDRG